MAKSNSITWYDNRNGTRQGSLKRPSSSSLSKFFKDGENYVSKKLKKATSHGFLLTENGKKLHKKKPSQLANGWFVDYLPGRTREFPTTFNAVIEQNGKAHIYKQEGQITTTALSRVGNVTLLNMMPLTEVQTLTNTNQNTYLLNQKWKIMWTNMSNVKMCYELYCVRPIGGQANTFASNLDSLTDLRDSSSGLQNVITTWKPSFTPELLKNYKIMSTSVIRLDPGSSAEIHGKDNIYRRVGEAEQTTDRTYDADYNTQIYCRYYGCPTGVVATAGGTTLTSAVFGDQNLQTSWITEWDYTYTRNDAASHNADVWGVTNVLSSVTAPANVVTMVETDHDITEAI